jgi:hypothetical protein
MRAWRGTLTHRLSLTRRTADTPCHTIPCMYVYSFLSQPHLCVLLRFEVGLAAVAHCTGGWVVTGGTDTGVMALVGRALHARMLEVRRRHRARALSFPCLHRHYRLRHSLLIILSQLPTPQMSSYDGQHVNNMTPVIGIVPFGTVLHKEDTVYGPKILLALNKLDKAHEEDCERANHEAYEASVECCVYYHKDKQNSPTTAALDRGHTHFLLVDNGLEAEGQWCAAIAFLRPLPLSSTHPTHPFPPQVW